MLPVTSQESLRSLLDTPRDTAVLRFVLATDYLRAGDALSAIRHLRASVEKYPGDFFAWRVLASAQAEAGQCEEALESCRRGMALAMEAGNAQAVKEMEVCASIIEQCAAERPQVAAEPEEKDGRHGAARKLQEAEEAIRRSPTPWGCS